MVRILEILAPKAGYIPKTMRRAIRDVTSTRNSNRVEKNMHFINTHTSDKEEEDKSSSDEEEEDREHVNVEDIEVGSRFFILENDVPYPAVVYKLPGTIHNKKVIQGETCYVHWIGFRYAARLSTIF